MIIQHSKNCIFEMDVIPDDESFDHEFGTEKKSTIDVDNFKVTVYIDTVPYDLTPGLKPDELEWFKQCAIKNISENYGQTVGAM